MKRAILRGTARLLLTVIITVGVIAGINYGIGGATTVVSVNQESDATYTVTGTPEYEGGGSAAAVYKVTATPEYEGD